MEVGIGLGRGAGVDVSECGSVSMGSEMDEGLDTCQRRCGREEHDIADLGGAVNLNN